MRTQNECALGDCRNQPEIDAWGRFELPMGDRKVYVGWIPLPMCRDHYDLLEGPAITTNPEA